MFVEHFLTDPPKKITAIKVLNRIFEKKIGFFFFQIVTFLKISKFFEQEEYKKNNTWPRYWSHVLLNGSSYTQLLFLWKFFCLLHVCPLLHLCVETTSVWNTSCITHVCTFAPMTCTMNTYSQAWNPLFFCLIDWIEVLHSGPSPSTFPSYDLNSSLYMGRSPTYLWTVTGFAKALSFQSHHYPDKNIIE